MDQGSNENHYRVYNFAPTVTKFCVMWEGLSLPHDTKFCNCRCEIVDSRAFPSWSLIHGLRWSGLIKAEPEHLLLWYRRSAPRIVRHPCQKGQIVRVVCVCVFVCVWFVAWNEIADINWNQISDINKKNKTPHKLSFVSNKWQLAGCREAVSFAAHIDGKATLHTAGAKLWLKISFPLVWLVRQFNLAIHNKSSLELMVDEPTPNSWSVRNVAVPCW